MPNPPVLWDIESDPVSCRQHHLHPEDVDPRVAGVTQCERNDAAVDEVAHDPVAGGPVTAVAESVVAAEVTAVAHGLTTEGAEAHGDPLIRNAPHPPPTTPLRCDLTDKGRSETIARWPASQCRRLRRYRGSGR